jgi:hypothetical protein
MLEQQAGIQAKIAAEPQKSSNAVPYVDGDTSNRVKTAAEPRKSSNAGPYVDGDTSN